MTLNGIFNKLRKVNNNQYKQFFGCLIFANILVSSFMAVICSDFIQSTLPEGGDSRKQIYLIFGVAIIGCFIFVLYAMGLFLRYKSKEVGVFLALGSSKKSLTNAIIKEITYIAVSAAIIGVIMGNVLALAIGKIFQFVAIDVQKEPFFISIVGFVPAVAFATAILLCMLIMGYFFMRKSNVIEIINEQRRSEPIKKEVTKKYLMIGIVMFTAGIFLATILPTLYANIFKQYLSSMFHIFYIFCVIGLYRILVYSIVVHKRGKNPQKYYKNLIPYGMLKFQGISMVRNMALITLLIVGALFAAFYLPSNITTGNALLKNNPVDVSYRLPSSSEQITEQEVVSLANEYQQQIQNYKEIEFIELLASGINRDEVDDDGKIIEKYEDEAYYRQFVSVTEINAKLNSNISVAEGTYKMIRSDSMNESLFFSFDDLDLAKNPATGVSEQLKFAGTEILNELIVDNGWDNFARFIINEKDYEKLRDGIGVEYIVKQVLFNMNDIDSSYEFARALFKEYCLKADESMKVHWFYDPFLEAKSIENGEEYIDAEHVVLKPDNPELELNWKYTPYFKVLFQKNMILQYAVQYLLFAYVAVVMLASVAIIAFTRSKSIGLRNKQVFEDLRKLGANNCFILQCVKGQLGKVYFLPTILGICVIYLYQILIFFQNDGHFLKSEMTAAFIDLGLCLLVAVYQFIGYRLALKEVKKIVGI